VNAILTSLLKVALRGSLPSGNNDLVLLTAAAGTLNFVTVPPIGFSEFSDISTT